MAHPWLGVEYQHRASLPAWLVKAAQARAAASGDQLPVAVIHQAGTRYDDALVVVRLADWLAWFGEVPATGDGASL